MRDISYLTDHYDEKIRKINELDAPVNFVFITDQHHMMNKFAVETGLYGGGYEDSIAHVESIQYIIDRCPGIQFVVSGGDIGNDYNPDPDMVRQSHQSIMDALYKLSVPVHCCIGNHDDAIGVCQSRDEDVFRKPILPDEMHRLCMKYCPTEENYYYIDDPKAPYRYAFLNTSDLPYVRDENGRFPFVWRLEMSDKQIEWLEQEVLPTDRFVVLFSHCAIHNEGIFGSDGTKGYMVKPYDDMRGASRVYYNMKKHQNVVALISGHVHYDNLVYDDGMVRLTTLCSLPQMWAAGCPKREMGTITETAFDVISIKEDKMYMTRFGAGEDRVAVIDRISRTL